MSSSGDHLVQQVRFESSLAHLANALDLATGQVTDKANLYAGDDVDRLLQSVEERHAA